MGFARGPDRATDSMTSTWWNDPKRTGWGVYHWLFQILNIFPAERNKETPVHPKSDKVPYLTQWSINRWVLSHALWPIAVHVGYRWLTGKDLPPITAWVFYAVAFQINAAHQLWVLRRMGHTYGHFDGDKHARDGVPDHAVGKTLWSLINTTMIRPAIAIALAYNTRKSTEFTWWLPAELFLYPIVLDIFFYTYHRACHESETLWKYHRTHHLTKHPNPLLSSYADTEQEIIEIALIPFLTYASLKLMGFPMPFHDWWICHSYIIFAEAFGHSGIRIWGTPPGTATMFLRATGLELTIEDHDLHHRKGWKSSYNYGKATRVWDRMFGTCLDRVEGYDDNIDYSNRVNFPLY